MSVAANKLARAGGTGTMEGGRSGPNGLRGVVVVELTLGFRELWCVQRADVM